MKTDRKRTDDDDVLEAMRSLPVETWNYKGDSTKRIGPMADEWAARFGGDGHVIPAPAAFGVTISAVKALADKVDRMGKRR